MSDTQNKTTANEKKTKKSKAAKVWIPILSVLLVFSLCVVGHFLYKSCHHKEDPLTGEYTISLHQPDQEKAPGWKMYGKGTVAQETFTDQDFTANGTEEITIAISNHEINEFYEQNKTKLNSSNDIEPQYYIEIRYYTGEQDYAEKTLVWDEANQYYVTSFSMTSFAKFCLDKKMDISVGARTDKEQYIYYIDQVSETEQEVWLIDTITACDRSKPITCMLWTKDFPQGSTTKEIARNDFVKNIYVGSLVHNIEASFLSACGNFNNDITFNVVQETQQSSLTIIGDMFLNECTSFNKEINLPNSLKTIVGDFLKQCTSFNNGSNGAEAKPLNMKNVENLTSGEEKQNFLYRCENFNQQVLIPNVTSIPSYFLAECHSYNQPFTLSDKITYLGGSFMHECRAMTSKITVECQPGIFVGYAHNQVLSTTDSGAACVNPGVPIAGTYKNEFYTWLNVDPGAPYYRHVYIDSGK